MCTPDQSPFIDRAAINGQTRTASNPDFQVPRQTIQIRSIVTDREDDSSFKRDGSTIG
jgi:hypothetical protein